MTPPVTKLDFVGFLACYNGVSVVLTPLTLQQKLSDAENSSSEGSELATDGDDSDGMEMDYGADEDAEKMEVKSKDE